MLLITSFFFFCSLTNRHHSSWLLAYLPAIAFKAAAAERDMHLIFSEVFTFSETHQVLKSLLMSWWVESGVLDEGDSAGVPQDSFKNHFRDMFLNVT